MVEGIDKLKARLGNIPALMQSNVAPVMLDGATRVVNAAKALVPKDTGELASTIHHTGIEETKNGGMRVTIIAGSDATRVGSAHQFQLAKILEFGTTQRPAQPFLLPAWRLNRKQIRAAIRKAVRDVIRQANS